MIWCGFSFCYLWSKRRTLFLGGMEAEVPDKEQEAQVDWKAIKSSSASSVSAFILLFHSFFRTDFKLSVSHKDFFASSVGKFKALSFGLFCGSFRWLKLLGQFLCQMQFPGQGANPCWPMIGSSNHLIPTHRSRSICSHQNGCSLIEMYWEWPKIPLDANLWPQG